MFYVRPLNDTIDTILPFGDAPADVAGNLRERCHQAGNQATSLFSRMVASVDFHLMLRKSRLDLMNLSEDQLRDLGITRSEAYREARKVWFHFR